MPSLLIHGTRISDSTDKYFDQVSLSDMCIIDQSGYDPIGVYESDSQQIINTKIVDNASVLVRSSIDENRYDEYYDSIYHVDYQIPDFAGYQIIGITLSNLYLLKNIECSNKVLHIYTGDNSFKYCHYEQVQKFKHIHAQNIDIKDKLSNLSLLPLIGPQRIIYKANESEEGIFYHHSMSHDFRKLFRRPKIIPKEEYYQKMAKCKYVVIMRGSGLDTYRLWEAIKYGCIPVIVIDKSSENFAVYLKEFLREVSGLKPIYQIPTFASNASILAIKF